MGEDRHRVTIAGHPYPIRLVSPDHRTDPSQECYQSVYRP